MHPLRLDGYVQTAGQRSDEISVGLRYNESKTISVTWSLRLKVKQQLQTFLENIEEIAKDTLYILHIPPISTKCLIFPLFPQHL